MDDQKLEAELYLELDGGEAAPPPFAITDEATADWAADKVLTARERRDRVKERCAAAIAAAEREVERTDAYFLPLLEAWARANPPRRGKSIYLTAATLSFRSVPAGPRVVDAARALDWARLHHPAAVRTREELDKEAIKAYVAAAGELPDGVEVSPAEERFSVK